MNCETSTPQVTTANQAAKALYPNIAKLDAFWEREADVNQCPSLELLDIRDEFWAMTIGPAGTPDSPIVFAPAEGQFRGYKPLTGLYEIVSESTVTSEILMNLDFCASCFPSRLNISTFLPLKTRQRIKSVVERAKDLLAVDEFFFAPKPYTLALKNGILRTDTLAFTDFNPNIPLLDTLPVR